PRRGRSLRRGTAVRYALGSGRGAPGRRGSEPRAVASEVAVARALAGRAHVIKEDETATYVYCLVQRARPPMLTRAPRGLPGTARVRGLDAGDGLWLVVADAPLSRYGEAPLEARLRDLEWVAACATAHEAVVEFAARGGTTVPLKLLTLFNDDERAIAHIRRLRPDSVEGAARLLLDAAFLLTPSRAARFKKVARAAATRLGRRGYELTLSGPWPPYNFVGGVA